MRQKPKGEFMSKAISIILVLVLFLGSAINSFADGSGSGSGSRGDERGGSGSGGGDIEGTGTTIAIVVGVIVLGVLFVWWIVDEVRSWAEADTPDNGIRMVSSENEISTEKTDNKTILNVFQHVEAGVTPNKDIYVGLRFQY
jgi:hypothetical protein